MGIIGKLTGSRWKELPCIAGVGLALTMLFVVVTSPPPAYGALPKNFVRHQLRTIFSTLANQSL